MCEVCAKVSQNIFSSAWPYVSPPSNFGLMQKLCKKSGTPAKHKKQKYPIKYYIQTPVTSNPQCGNNSQAH